MGESGGSVDSGDTDITVEFGEYGDIVEFGKSGDIVDLVYLVDSGECDGSGGPDDFNDSGDSVGNGKCSDSG